MDSSSSDRTALSDTTSRMNDMLGALQYRDFRYYWFSALSFVLGWQILRMVLHDKKRKLRPNSKGKWVWIEQEKYEGRKYE